MCGFANGTVPRSFDNIFKYNGDELRDHMTKQSNMLQNIRCCFNFSKHFPLYSILNVWNIWSK